MLMLVLCRTLLWYFLSLLDLCLGDKLSTVWTVPEWLLNKPGAVLAGVGYFSGLLAHQCFDTVGWAAERASSL